MQLIAKIAKNKYVLDHSLAAVINRYITIAHIAVIEMIPQFI